MAHKPLVCSISTMAFTSDGSNHSPSMNASVDVEAIMADIQPRTYCGSLDQTRLQKSTEILIALGLEHPCLSSKRRKSRTVKCMLMIGSGAISLLAVVVMAILFAGLCQSHSILQTRVAYLELELARLKYPCDCEDEGRSSGGRSSKFGYLITTDLKQNADEMTNLDASAFKAHSVQGTPGGESPGYEPWKERKGALTGSMREWMPPIARIRRSDKRGSNRQTRRRGRIGKTRQHNRLENATSVQIPGVHFEANLNRTTTIGVAGWIPHWSLSSSIAQHLGVREVLEKFYLRPRGNVTVYDKGLYYVYSQIMYYDPHEYIGHSIVVNGVEAFTCIAPVEQRKNKYKTCFIGGLVYIPANARVGIKMLYTPRQVCLFEDTSYFGMFKVR